MTGREAPARRLVSCVVPVYNGARFLAEAVQSVLDQTHRPLEIVISDDGSTDRTMEIAERLAAERSEPDAQIRVLSAENGGTSVARNRGAAAARGEYLTFLDVDDLWDPEKLEIQLAALAEPAVDVSVSGIQNVWLDEVAEEGERYRESAIARPMVGYLTQTMVLARALFERIGAFREDLNHSGDTEWMARAKSAGLRIHATPQVLVHRRLHRDNMSRSTAKKTDEYLDLARALIARGRTTP